MSKETKRMDSHVSFVENIYSSVQTPFHFIMNRVNNLIKIKQLNNNLIKIKQLNNKWELN